MQTLLRPRPMTALTAALIAALPAAARALDTDAVGGNVTRTLFGPGTGVIVGMVDSGILTSHPALAGNDSLGRPRLLAQANFVLAEPTNTGQDLADHGTGVLGVIASSDPTRLGMAPDVRYINARVLDATNSSTDSIVMNGIGFAVDNGADIINLSINFPTVGGNALSRPSMLADYLADARNIAVVVSAGNNGTTPFNHTAKAPADAFNVFSVASSQRAGGFNQVATFSAWGIQSDGRARPDITAIGDTVVTPDAAGSFSTSTGTSYSAAQVSGMLASQIQYGRDHALSTDVRVLRATMLNSASKIQDHTGQPWAPGNGTVVSGVYQTFSPLSLDSGAGQINGARLVSLYTAGQHGPGAVPARGWDLKTISSPSATFDYTINQSLTPGNVLTATLTWNRHVAWVDNNNNGTIDGVDGFTTPVGLSNFDLHLFRDGTLIAQTGSLVETIEQINWTIDTPGTYSLQVNRWNTLDAPNSETYALAWDLSPIPEPGSLLLLAPAFLLLIRRRNG